MSKIPLPIQPLAEGVRNFFRIRGLIYGETPTFSASRADTNASATRVQHRSSAEPRSGRLTNGDRRGRRGTVRRWIAIRAQETDELRRRLPNRGHDGFRRSTNRADERTILHWGVGLPPAAQQGFTGAPTPVGDRRALRWLRQTPHRSREPTQAATRLPASGDSSPALRARRAPPRADRPRRA